MVIGFSVNLLSVLIAAVVSFVLGWLWYSPLLFGNLWMKLSGKTMKDMQKGKQNSMALVIIAGFITQLVMSWILAIFISATGGVSYIDGICVAFLSWVGYVATIQLGTVLWDGKSMSLFWLNAFHWLVSMIVMGAIIGAMM